MLKYVLVIFLIIAAVVLAPTLKKSNVSTLINTNIESPPKPTPFLFQELTIPYLRSREYKSSLSGLSDYSQTGTYTSYLTSYDSDGLKINALLTKPKSPMPQEGYPAVVFVHGYIAPTVYQTTERYQDYVDQLARNGFVVLKIDLRGHDASEGLPTGSYYSGDYVIDTLNAYAALEDTDFVNPKQIGLWGHSMAGNITLRAFAAKQTIPALVIWAGAGFTYTDLIAYRIMDTGYRPPMQNTEVQNRRKLLTETHGNFSADHDFWKQVPATNYLDGVRGAIELHHAVDDTTVSVEYSRNLIKVLEGTNIPHELFEYSSGGIIFRGQRLQLPGIGVWIFTKNIWTPLLLNN